MISLTPVGSENNHFIVRADQPVAIEVLMVDGQLHAFVYDHVDISEDSEIIGAFDSTLEVNTKWSEGRPDGHLGLASPT